MADNRKKIIFFGENLYRKVRLIHIFSRIGFGHIYKYKRIRFILYFPIGFLYVVQFLKIRLYRGRKWGILNDVNLKNVFKYPISFIDYFDQLKTLNNLKVKPRKKFCAFIVSNPENLDRIRFYEKLSQYKKIDSFGKVYQNAEETHLFSGNLSQNQKNICIYSEYKFVICFENSCAKKYITEKIFNAYLGGAIPIYSGAEDIGDFFYLDSMVSINTYKNHSCMIKRIIEIDQNVDLYSKIVRRKKVKVNVLNKIWREFQQFKQN